MIYLVLSYKYNEYRVFRHMQNLTEINETYIEKISLAREILENKNTKAYKNKILKSQQWLKNPGEEVVFLITEENYNKYTKDEIIDPQDAFISPNLLDEKSLIETMTIPQKWIYLIFDKDTR